MKACYLQSADSKTPRSALSLLQNWLLAPVAEATHTRQFSVPTLD